MWQYSNTDSATASGQVANATAPNGHNFGDDNYDSLYKILCDALEAVSTYGRHTIEGSHEHELASTRKAALELAIKAYKDAIIPDAPVDDAVDEFDAHPFDQFEKMHGFSSGTSEASSEGRLDSTFEAFFNDYDGDDLDRLRRPFSKLPQNPRSKKVCTNSISTIQITDEFKDVKRASVKSDLTLLVGTEEAEEKNEVMKAFDFDDKEVISEASLKQDKIRANYEEFLARRFIFNDINPTGPCGEVWDSEDREEFEQVFLMAESSDDETVEIHSSCNE